MTDIVLAVNYKPEIMAQELKRYEELYNVRIAFSIETEPLGTGAERVFPHCGYIAFFLY